MTLVQEVKYESGIKDLKEVNPEVVFSMICDVRRDIGRINASFLEKDLKSVLGRILDGKYEIRGAEVTSRIDLSEAKRIVEYYKEYSEGGCQSCQNLRKDVIDAEDHLIGSYCNVEDPDYNRSKAGYESGLRYAGLTPKVRIYFHIPCADSWKPIFSPKLEELVKREPLEENFMASM